MTSEDYKMMTDTITALADHYTEISAGHQRQAQFEATLATLQMFLDHTFNEKD